MTAPSNLSRRLVLAAACAFVAGPALAGDKKEDKKKEGEGQALDPTIKLQAITIPIIVNGRIVNYVFVSMTMKLTSSTDIAMFEGKEPALRDAIIRAAYKTPFVRPDTWKEVDAKRLTSFVLGQANQLTGKGMFSSVEITKQIPRQQLMPPKPGGAKAASSPDLDP